ncbi:cbb3-type cytochrome c oxidase N-terminal domain-containing protein [Larkinella arboricola]|uniref:Cytochrome c oxidase cbb3-type subunit 3 n=1 Tax=Larkinella arboricola TaxID=643671 RepID=A0A327WUY3_LARAB|nr:cbb3-type cytochrome c oxidase N-terminal domain-containing protein [Larkinella arboricola]RAJ95867.1 cytochrome c oxidase cbb3-type subunit 3 [Larkinella arboricola]
MHSIFLLNNGLLAQAPTTSIWNIKSGEDLLLLTLAMVLLAGLIAVLAVALNLAFILKKALEPESAAKPVDTRTTWQRIMGLHALSQEKDLVMEHSYDGITELDNPTPPWFMGLFYGSIGVAVVYLLVFHVIGTGNIMEQEYTQEMAIATKQREEYIQRVAGSINENTVTLLKDEQGIAEGKSLFAQNCVACHGANGEGKVGPNLTDAYWLHGGDVKAIFHVINEGVPEKGMLSWKKQLNPLQVQQVASYILSLQGSNPAGAKEPQGDKVDATEAVALNK